MASLVRTFRHTTPPDMAFCLLNGNQSSLYSVKSLHRTARGVLTTTESVLVVENGYIDTSPSVQIPYRSGLPDNVTPLYQSLISTAIPGLGNRTFSVPVGNVVGGGSVVNGMMLDRVNLAILFHSSGSKIAGLRRGLRCVGRAGKSWLGMERSCSLFQEGDYVYAAERGDGEYIDFVIC